MKQTYVPNEKLVEFARKAKAWNKTTLPSHHNATEIILVFLHSVVNTLADDGSVRAKGINPLSGIAHVKSWLDGMSDRHGNRAVTAALYGAVSRVIQELEKEFPDE